MKVVVTGASGLLGRAVRKAFENAGHDVIGLSFSRTGSGLLQVDLQDKKAVESLLKYVQPDVVVHCAAERRPDVAEKNPEAVTKLNVAVPAHLSSLSLPSSSSKPYFLIYISTDYVFPGNAPPPPRGYEPGDVVDPTNLYGRSKEEGEREIVAGFKSGGKGTILRVPVLYGDVEENDESAVNVLLDITRKAAKGDKVKMDHWAIRYPTNVDDVAKALLGVATLSQTTTDPIPPILHFSTQEPYTKYEMCELLASLHSPPLDISKTMIPECDGPKPGDTVRPKDCHLVNTELERLGVNVNSVEFKAWWKERLQQETK